jgi:hypothetical protein
MRVLQGDIFGLDLALPLLAEYPGEETFLL